MGDTTAATERVWRELTARLTHPAGTDLLQRHLLCQATGCHDDDGHGTCRDCGKRLSAGDDVAYTRGSIL